MRDILIVAIVLVLPIVLAMIFSRRWAKSSGRPASLQGEVIYADELIQIWPEYIVFLRYYFPTYDSKWVRLDAIERIWTERLTMRTGKWRIHGTGNFATWYPEDGRRPKRSRIFFAKLKTQRVRIGFTVERPEEVERILREKALMQ